MNVRARSFKDVDENICVCANQIVCSMLGYFFVDLDVLDYHADSIKTMNFLAMVPKIGDVLHHVIS